MHSPKTAMTFNRTFLDAFQMEDVAKMAMKGGGLMAHEQGCGKTLMALLYGKATRCKNALFIVPQDIVPQWQREAEEKFLTDLRPIASVRDAIELRRRFLKEGLTGWYITYYEALSQCGKVEEMGYCQWEQGQDTMTPYLPAKKAFGNRKGIARFDPVSLTACPRCGIPQDGIKCVLTPRQRRDMVGKHGRDTINELLRRAREVFSPDGKDLKWRYATATNGKKQPKLTQAVCDFCGYNHMSRRLKPAYYWLRDLFDLIVVDEGTKIKNMQSQTSQAIQGMRAKHRLLLTGTPIKNYIPDMFALMWWAMGNNSPRFPFDHKGGQAKFEKEYCTVEYTLDKQGRKKNRKVLPQVSNLVSFWRLAHAGCIRRTKKETGVPIVPIVWHDIRAPFGTLQAGAYSLWLRHFDEWFIEKHPDMAISDYPKLIERSAAILGQFAKLQFMCTLPEAEPDRWAQSKGLIVSNFTPKNVAVIRQTMELVEQNRKVVIFSAVKEHSLWLSNVLDRLGYPTLSIVEDRNGNVVTISPKGRADLVLDFVQDGYPILCASIHAMNLGHNLDCASAVIVNGLPWDFATFDQAINRVHRITSKRPVDVYIAQSVCRLDTDEFRAGASLDQKMRKLIREKGECAALALDGVLPEKIERQIEMQKFLADLAKEWKNPTDTIDEAVLGRALLSAGTAYGRTSERPAEIRPSRASHEVSFPSVGFRS